MNPFVLISTLRWLSTALAGTALVLAFIARRQVRRRNIVDGYWMSAPALVSLSVVASSLPMQFSDTDTVRLGANIASLVFALTATVLQLLGFRRRRAV